MSDEASNEASDETSNEAQGMRHFSGNTEEELWQQVQYDYGHVPDLLQYQAILHQGDNLVILDVDIDPGGGFEGGYAFTTFTAPFHNHTGFRFGLHHEGFLDEVGKFFGMQDIEIGDPEFDRKVVVKSNDEARVRSLFADQKVRKVLQDLTHFTFEIRLQDTQAHDNAVRDNIVHDNAVPANSPNANLELVIEEEITDLALLRSLYSVVFRVLAQLKQQEQGELTH